MGNCLACQVALSTGIWECRGQWDVGSQAVPAHCHREQGYTAENTSGQLRPGAALRVELTFPAPAEPRHPGGAAPLAAKPKAVWHARGFRPQEPCVQGGRSPAFLGGAFQRTLGRCTHRSGRQQAHSAVGGQQPSQPGAPRGRLQGKSPSAPIMASH